MTVQLARAQARLRALGLQERPPALQLVLVLVAAPLALAAAAQEQLQPPVAQRRVVEALGAWPSVVAVMVLMMPDLGGVQPWVRQRGRIRAIQAL